MTRPCLPMNALAGPPGCLDLNLDCGHGIALDADYCVEVTTRAVCATHTDIADNGDITHAEPWPCRRAKAVTA